MKIEEKLAIARDALQPFAAFHGGKDDKRTITTGKGGKNLTMAHCADAAAALEALETPDDPGMDIDKAEKILGEALGRSIYDLSLEDKANTGEALAFALCGAVRALGFIALAAEQLVEKKGASE